MRRPCVELLQALHKLGALSAIEIDRVRKALTSLELVETDSSVLASAGRYSQHVITTTSLSLIYLSLQYQNACGVANVTIYN